MTTEELTTAEKQVLGFLGHTHIDGVSEPGSFTCKLIDAMFSADNKNSSKLKKVYPDLMQAVNDWRFGDLAVKAGIA